MQYVLFGFLGILFLFFLSREVSKNLSKILFSISKKETFVIYLLSFIFLPGVVLHELSHLITANLLLVSTGEIEFFPQIHGKEVKLGSVEVSKTDPIRRFLIGIAPLVVGITFLVVIFLFFYPFMLFSYKSAFVLYIIFEIANTMFSSRKDMEGALGFFVLLIFFISVFYFFGARISPGILNQFLQNDILLKTIDELIFIAIGVDIAVVFIIWVFNRGLSKIINGS